MKEIEVRDFQDVYGNIPYAKIIPFMIAIRSQRPDPADDGPEVRILREREIAKDAR